MISITLNGFKIYSDFFKKKQFFGNLYGLTHFYFISPRNLLMLDSSLPKISYATYKTGPLYNCNWAQKRKSPAYFAPTSYSMVRNIQVSLARLYTCQRFSSPGPAGSYGRDWTGPAPGPSRPR